MKIILNDASDLKDIIDVLAKVAEEVPLTISEKGISSKTLSEDKTTMSILEILSEIFNEFELEENISFRVKIRDFNKILKRATKNDVLELSLEKDKGILKIVFKNSKNGAIRSFDLQVSIENVEDIGEPKVDLPIEFEILAGDLKDILDDVSKVGEEVEFEYKNSSIVIKSEGQGRAYIATLTEGNPLILLKSSVSEASSKYGVELLSSVAKKMDSNTTTKVAFGSQLPIKIQVQFTPGGSLTYWVAPRI
ncbi:DNA polymerase sliding clamp [Fervidicoccus fontis]|uniref:DNA polymerase sliding clamp n=1 Tax=Fervidicoccus fontis TaxID=683846 RepID=A0A843AD54_9CREN|nr:DNA polymerase sliding clamp [Fervidicoccus fontis]MBE9391037.1 DNA polymerase sliding clamp [Fervidicoccus fontis]